MAAPQTPNLTDTRAIERDFRRKTKIEDSCDPVASISLAVAVLLLDWTSIFRERLRRLPLDQQQ